MKPEKVFNFFNIFKNDNLSIIYQGVFSNFILGTITELVKEYLIGKQSLIKIRNKLSFLIIEAFQNTMRYGDHHYKDQADLAYELFILRNLGEVFHIATVNLIENARIGYVHNKLQEVNTLDENKLKDLYIKILTNKKLTDRGGAGLGFIEMVRKTKEKLDFDFVPVSKDASFFYFQLKIKPKDLNITPKYIPISEAKKLHKLITDENIIMIHKGDYDTETILPLLKLAEQNFNAQHLNYQKKTFLILVEILQNISKHSLKMDGKNIGITLISQKNNKYIIASGNYIENSKKHQLQAKLNQLKNMSKPELKELYINSLKNKEIKSGGLGFIEIARITQNFNFDFFKIDEEKTLFTISIEV